MMDKPTPPPMRLVCDYCGDITASGGKHTFFMCRLLGWLKSKF